MMPMWPRKGFAVANIVSISVTSAYSIYCRGNIAPSLLKSNRFARREGAAEKRTGNPLKWVWRCRERAKRAAPLQPSNCAVNSCFVDRPSCSLPQHFRIELNVPAGLDTQVIFGESDAAAVG